MSIPTQQAVTATGSAVWDVNTPVPVDDASGATPVYRATLFESVNRILNTTLGSRVMRPTFGSRIHELIDRTPDEAWKLDFTQYVHEALKAWEPRVRLVDITFGSSLERDGALAAVLTLRTLEEGETINMEYVYDA